MTPQELRQEVFDYFSNEHNLHLLESEYDYIINLCQNQLRAAYVELKLYSTWETDNKSIVEHHEKLFKELTGKQNL